MKYVNNMQDALKEVYSSKKYLVHIPSDLQIGIGSKVLVTSCQPVSKKKRFKISSIL